MTTPRFDELIHAPTRLSIVALLGAADWAEFRFIRDTLDMTDSALSRQLTMLENAGYVEIRKAFIGKPPRNWAIISGTRR
jgi:DNA-binding transcriptional ArsR family regulator